MGTVRQLLAATLVLHAAIWPTAVATGPGLCATFENYDQFLALEDGPFDDAFPFTSDVTLMLWARYTEQKSGASVVFGLQTYSQPNMLQPLLGAGIDGWVFTSTYGVPLIDDPLNWHHYAISFEGATGAMRGYRDGVFIGESSYPDNTIGGEGLHLTFGKNLYGWGENVPFTFSRQQSFRGQIDEFSMWNRVLSDDEVMDRASRSLDPNEAGLILYYDFNDPQDDGAIIENLAGLTAGSYNLRNGWVKSLSDEWPSGKFVDSSAGGDCGSVDFDGQYCKWAPSMAGVDAKAEDVRPAETYTVAAAFADGYRTRIPLPDPDNVSPSLKLMSPVDGTLYLDADGANEEDFTDFTQLDVTDGEVAVYYEPSMGASSGTLHFEYVYNSASDVLDVSVELHRDSPPTALNISVVTPENEAVDLVLKGLHPLGLQTKVIMTKGASEGLGSLSLSSSGEAVELNYANDYADSKFQYAPADGLFGAPLDVIEYRVVDELGLMSGVGYAEVHVNQIDNIPFGLVDAVGDVYEVEEDSSPFLIDVGGDDDTVTQLAVLIKELPTLGDLYLPYDENGNTCFEAGNSVGGITQVSITGDCVPITEVYNRFKIPDQIEQYVSSVVSVSSFWGGPPFDSYHPRNVIGPQVAFNLGEGLDERPWTASGPWSDNEDSPILILPGKGDKVLAPKGGSNLPANIFEVHAAEPLEDSTVDILFPTYYRCAEGSGDECELEACFMAGNLEFPGDCDPSLPLANPQDIVYGISIMEIRRVTADVWSPLNKGISASTAVGGETATAFGAEYGYEHNNADYYQQGGYTEYIEVMFDAPVYVSEVTVGSPRGFGHVTRMMMKDLDGEDFILYDGGVDKDMNEEYVTNRRYNEYSPLLCKPPFSSDHLRVEVDTSAETGIDDWNYIEFIQLIGSPKNQPAILTYPSTQVIYMPHENANGVDTISVALSDCLHDRFRESDLYTKTVDLTAVNDRPIVETSAISLEEDTMELIDLNAVVTEYDGDELIYSIKSLTHPSGGNTEDLTFFSAVHDENGDYVMGEKIEIEGDTVEIAHGAFYVVATKDQSVFYQQDRTEMNSDGLTWSMEWEVSDGVSDGAEKSTATITMLPRFRCSQEHVVATVGECGNDFSVNQEITYSFDDPDLCGPWEESYLSERDYEKTVPCDYVPYTSSVGIFVIVIVAVLIVASLLAQIRVYQLMQNPKMKARQPIFLMMFLMGCVVLALSLLTLLGKNEGNCMLRAWALNIGSICMFAPLLPKLWRAFRVLDNRRLRMIKITNLTVTKQVLQIILVDVIILLIWSFASPEYETKEELRLDFITDPIERSVCVSDTNNYATISLLYKALLLVAGCYVSYKVRAIDERLGEMKPMLLTIYNTSVFGAIVFLIGTTDPTVKFSVLMKAVAVLFVVVVAQLALILGPLIKSAMHGEEALSDSTSVTMTATQDTAAAKAEITQLQEENAELKGQLKVLQKEIEEFNAAAAAAKKDVGGPPM